MSKFKCIEKSGGCSYGYDGECDLSQEDGSCVWNPIPQIKIDKRWIPIEVARPIDGQEIYITDGKHVSWVTITYYKFVSSFYYINNGIRSLDIESNLIDENDVTHWMPAPIPSIEGLK